MIKPIVGLKLDHEMLRTVVGNQIRVGPIAAVDPERGYRVRLGDQPDGSAYLSPWLPHPESGGQTKTWAPLSVGQVVTVLMPSGDPRQAVIVRSGFTGIDEPPSQDMSANVLEGLGIKVTVKNGKLTIEGDLIVEGNADFREGYVHHNGQNIGDTHVHGGVRRGSSNTDPPH